METPKRPGIATYLGIIAIFAGIGVVALIFLGGQVSHILSTASGGV